MIKHILIGLILIGAGGIIIYFSPKILEIMGKSERSEKYLGGTKNGIVLFGFLIIVLGVLTMFGIFKSTPLT